MCARTVYINAPRSRLTVRPHPPAFRYFTLHDNETIAAWNIKKFQSKAISHKTIIIFIHKQIFSHASTSNDARRKKSKHPNPHEETSPNQTYSKRDLARFSKADRPSLFLLLFPPCYPKRISHPIVHAGDVNFMISFVIVMRLDFSSVVVVGTLALQREARRGKASGEGYLATRVFAREQQQQKVARCMHNKQM